MSVMPHRAQSRLLHLARVNGCHRLRPAKGRKMEMETNPFDRDREAEKDAATRQALAEIAAGRVVSAEAANAWIESLGTDHPLPMPEPGQ